VRALLLILLLIPAAALADGPQIQSMSVLTFSPDGVLFVGDSMGGRVVAIPMDEPAAAELPERFSVSDLEANLGALLGTSADEIAVHDMAVHPLSKNTYVSVSRGRGAWDTRWKLPNDLADAKVLVRIGLDGQFSLVDLSDVEYTSLDLPEPVAADKMHRWKEGVSQRVDMLTDLAFHDGRIFATGLSNEEFASAFWHASYPFQDDAAFATLETYHAPHDAFETHAPVRTFLPYNHEGATHVLAAYLCTPLTVFRLDDLTAGGHVRGATVAEFGSGNYPLDMVRCEYQGKEFVVLANSMLPLLTFDPAAAAAGEPITEQPGSYTAGIPYVARAGAGGRVGSAHPARHGHHPGQPPAVLRRVRSSHGCGGPAIPGSCWTPMAGGSTNPS